MGFNKNYNEICELSKDIFLNPELGFKEFKTKEKVIGYIKKYIPNVEIEEFAITGFKFTLSCGKENSLNVGVLAELDAVYSPTHIYSNKTTGAGHSCGHHAQVGIALSLFSSLLKEDFYKTLNYDVTFIFTPAEEYVDLKYRKELQKTGEIEYIGGKPNCMKEGAFDNIDCVIAVHAMGIESDKHMIELNCSFAGFLYKNYKFTGKSAHAGFYPEDGVNAYSMSTIFNTGVGLLRQQFSDNDYIRVNPIVVDYNMGTNIICSEITIGTDLRAKNVDIMLKTADKLDSVAKGSAMCLQGNVEIDTEMGYMPFVQDNYLTSFAKKTFDNFDKIDEVVLDNVVAASGDLGDLSYMMPCIQIGFNGFKGTVHGKDFDEVDSEYIYDIFPEYLYNLMINLKGIDKSKLYKRSYEDYKEVISKIV